MGGRSEELQWGPLGYAEGRGVGGRSGECGVCNPEGLFCCLSGSQCGGPGVSPASVLPGALRWADRSAPDQVNAVEGALTEIGHVKVKAA